MTASRYIARLMGPALLAIGIGMVIGLVTEGDGYPALMKEFLGSRPLIFLTAALTLVAGLAIVNAHNLWVADWRVWSRCSAGCSSSAAPSRLCFRPWCNVSAST